MTISIFLFLVGCFLLATQIAHAAPQPCDSGVCHTAIGDISTNPQSFIGVIFAIVLSLSGGIAILLIMFSGYQLILSAGNPEKTQAARETLTSAIIGLLFIIFSVVILQVIGVDVLHLPGFGK